MKSIALLYLEKPEQLSEKEKEILLQCIKLEATPIFATNDSSFVPMRGLTDLSTQ